MSDRKIVPQGNARNPDGDLALAFLGSILVGIISPTIPVLINGWVYGFSFGWVGSLWMLLAMWGGFVGLVWGILNVIVSATAAPESRRTATYWMFSILCLAIIVIESVLIRGIADV